MLIVNIVPDQSTSNGQTCPEMKISETEALHDVDIARQYCSHDKIGHH